MSSAPPSRVFRQRTRHSRRQLQISNSSYEKSPRLLYQTDIGSGRRPAASLPSQPGDGSGHSYVSRLRAPSHAPWHRFEHQLIAAFFSGLNQEKYRAPLDTVRRPGPPASPLSLPVELFRIINDFLPSKSLRNLCLTCWHFLEIDISVRRPMTLGLYSEAAKSFVKRSREYSRVFSPSASLCISSSISRPSLGLI
jgi:hypothetical protein